MNNIEQCQVLGPFNSGTTLMQRYLNQLFRDFSPDSFIYWKHSLPPEYFPCSNIPADTPDYRPIGKFPGILFLCMVRSPYFWINSTLRRPYNLAIQTNSRDVAERLRSPVVFRKNQRFCNIIQVWNHYYRGYTKLLESGNRVLYIRLEDLVKDADSTLQKLDTCLQRKSGIDVQRTIKKISAIPSKKHNTHGAPTKPIRIWHRN